MDEQAIPDRDGPYSTEQILPEVYDALRELAGHRIRTRAGVKSISATDLVHEAYLKLCGEGHEAKWDDRGHFFAAAAEAMRRVMIDRIRFNHRKKRGEGKKPQSLDHVELVGPMEDDQLLALNEALDEFGALDPRTADLVKMRFFVGMTLDQIAEATGISVRTVTRNLAYARGWLADHLVEE